MLEITEETRRAFLSDNSHKELSIEFEGYALEDINIFVGDSENNSDSQWSMTDQTGETRNKNFGGCYIIDKDNQRVNVLTNAFDLTYFNNFPKFLFSCNPKLEINTTNTIEIQEIAFYLNCIFDDGDTRYWHRTISGDDITPQFLDDLENERYILHFRCNRVDTNYGYKVVSFKSFTIRMKYKTISGGNGTNVTLGVRDIMCTLVQEQSSYTYPEYERSPIVNGVYPPIAPSDITNKDIMFESFQLTESICSKDNLKFGLSEAANCSFNVANIKDDYINKVFRAYITCNNTQKIPLGRFKITSVKKETKYNFVTRSITAYDEMSEWDKDATDWYANYMFGVSSDNYTFGGFEFPRQMFSTYYNFAKYMGYEDDANYTEELVFDSGNISNLPVTTRIYNFENYIVNVNGEDIVCHNYGDMQKFEINNVSSDYLYKFKKRNMGEFSDDWIWENWLSFIKRDSNPKKGVLTNGSVMVEEVLNDNTYNRYLVNVDDYFAISDNCTSLNIYYATHVKFVNEGHSSGTTSSFIDEVYLYRTPCPNWVKLLVNKSARLVYYDWETLEWSTTTCTVRDVFRSLMEINGAFVKINRQGGIECVYSRKGSLYPSETLYPSEDLFPIEDAMLIPSAKYSVSKQEDYQSADFGKIQIKSRNNDKDAITLRTFVGNANYDSTYIIDDNVFFCNSKVKFNYRDNVNGQGVTPYDVLPELNTILGRMFNRISNMGYTPHDTTLVGMPWVETGDRITLVTYQDAFESFVFRRTMKGIQGLFDKYEAHGDNIIEAYKEVEV